MGFFLFFFHDSFITESIRKFSIIETVKNFNEKFIINLKVEGKWSHQESFQHCSVFVLLLLLLLLLQMEIFNCHYYLMGKMKKLSFKIFNVQTNTNINIFIFFFFFQFPFNITFSTNAVWIQMWFFKTQFLLLIQ